MTTSVDEQRQRLLVTLNRAFELSGHEADQLAEALKRGGPLVKPMHWEIMVGHPRLKSRHDTLGEELRDWFRRQQVPAPWSKLLPDRVRPNLKYLYYILRDGETYGVLYSSNNSI